jgi:hypothetical protein
VYTMRPASAMSRRIKGSWDPGVINGGECASLVINGDAGSLYLPFPISPSLSKTPLGLAHGLSTPITYQIRVACGHGNLCRVVASLNQLSSKTPPDVIQPS